MKSVFLNEYLVIKTRHSCFNLYIRYNCLLRNCFLWNFYLLTLYLPFRQWLRLVSAGHHHSVPEHVRWDFCYWLLICSKYHLSGSTFCYVNITSVYNWSLLWNDQGLFIMFFFLYLRKHILGKNFQAASEMKKFLQYFFAASSSPRLLSPLISNTTF